MHGKEVLLAIIVPVYMIHKFLAMHYMVYKYAHTISSIKVIVVMCRMSEHCHNSILSLLLYNTASAAAPIPK